MQDSFILNYRKICSNKERIRSGKGKTGGPGISDDTGTLDPDWSQRFGAPRGPQGNKKTV